MALLAFGVDGYRHEAIPVWRDQYIKQTGTNMEAPVNSRGPRNPRTGGLLSPQHSAYPLTVGVLHLPLDIQSCIRSVKWGLPPQPVSANPLIRP